MKDSKGASSGLIYCDSTTATTILLLLLQEQLADRPCPTAAAAPPPPPRRKAEAAELSRVETQLSREARAAFSKPVLPRRRRR